MSAKITKILLDPGHGGKDGGAWGPTKLKESNVVLTVALKLGVLLKAMNISVSYTRTTDVYPSLADRYNQANREGVDYFISIHANSDGPTAKGIETLCRTSNSVAHRLATSVQDAMIAATKDTNRGIKFRTDLAVLNGTKMPAILPEIGFISNPATEAEFKKDAYLSVIAGSIRDGIAKFLGGSYPPTPAPANPAPKPNPEPEPVPEPEPTTGELTCPHCGEAFGILIVNQK